jgi:hypothetical protein
MTEKQAEKVANILIGVAAAGAVFYILGNPSLRRLAWQMARTAAATSGPAWLVMELKHAWDESADTTGQPHGI